MDVRLKLKEELLNLPTPKGARAISELSVWVPKRHGDRVNIVWPTGFLEHPALAVTLIRAQTDLRDRRNTG